MNTNKIPFYKRKMLVIPLVALFALALISATVYVYVSNTATATVNISRPMQTWFGTDESQTSLTLNALGGNAFNLVVNERNNGNSPAQVYNLLLQVTAPAGTTFDGKEFTRVVTTAEGDVTSLLKYINPTTGIADDFANIGSQNTNVALIMMSATPQPATFSFGSGVTHTSDITITTNAGIATGAYVIKACTINNLVNAHCA